MFHELVDRLRSKQLDRGSIHRQSGDGSAKAMRCHVVAAEPASQILNPVNRSLLKQQIEFGQIINADSLDHRIHQCIQQRLQCWCAGGRKWIRCIHTVLPTEVVRRTSQSSQCGRSLNETRDKQ